MLGCETWAGLDLNASNIATLTQRYTSTATPDLLSRLTHSSRVNLVFQIFFAGVGQFVGFKRLYMVFILMFGDHLSFDAMNFSGSWFSNFCDQRFFESDVLYILINLCMGEFDGGGSDLSL